MPTPPAPRTWTGIVSGTVDIGAYEFQGPGSVISYAWLERYGLPTDGSADATDPDGDGLNTWQEWRADTNPTNALSALRMVTVTNGKPGLRVTWQSVPTRTYGLDRATSLGSLLSFSSLASNIVGQAGTKRTKQGAAIRSFRLLRWSCGPAAE